MKEITAHRGVLLAALTGVSCSYATLGIGLFPIFVQPLSEAFGWSRTDISLAFTIFSFNLVLFAVPYGRLLDKKGVRPILLPALFLFGICFAMLTTLDGNLLSFYLAYFVLGFIGVATIPSAYSKIVLGWFDRELGLALAIALSGVGISSIIIAPLALHIMDAYGFRAVYGFLAALILLVCLPIVTLFLRERDSQEKHENPILAIPASLFISRQFILLLLIFLLLGVITVGFGSHLLPLVLGRGFSTYEISVMASLGGVMLIAGRMACGYLLDRYHAPRIAGYFIACAIFGFTLLAFGPVNFITSCVAYLFINLAIGAEFDLMAYLIGKYFGLDVYGRIYGYIFAAFYLGAGSGAWLTAYDFDQSGSYQRPLFMCIPIGVAICLMLLRLGPYKNELKISDDKEVICPN